MSKIKEAELLFAKLEKLSKEANMSVREYILEKGTVEEQSNDSYHYLWGGKQFSMQDMSHMVFYIQPQWEKQIVMILESYYTVAEADRVEFIDYALWRGKEVSDRYNRWRWNPTKTVYNIEFETTTADDRWGATNDWIYLNLDDVLVNSSFLNWKFNPLEVTE